MTEEERFYDLRFYSGLNVNDIDVAHILNKDQKDRRYVSSKDGINHQIIKKMVEDDNYIISPEERIRAFNINIMAVLCAMSSVAAWIYSLISINPNLYTPATNLVLNAKKIQHVLILHARIHSLMARRQKWFFDAYNHILNDLYGYKITYELQKANTSLKPKQYLLQWIIQLTNFITTRYKEYLKDFASDIEGSKTIEKILTEFQNDQSERR